MGTSPAGGSKQTGKRGADIAEKLFGKHAAGRGEHFGIFIISSHNYIGKKLGCYHGRRHAPLVKACSNVEIWMYAAVGAFIGYTV